MITGNVNQALDPSIPIDIEGDDGNFHSTEVVLDTGFNGELALPFDAIQRLGLTYRGQSAISLAVGEVLARYYDGTALWHGRRRDLQVLETDGESLIGMSLLEGSVITIQARAGGSVLIEEDAP